MYACFYEIKRKKSELSCFLLPLLRRLLHFDLQCTKLVLHCLQLLLLLCQPCFKLLLHFLLVCCTSATTFIVSALCQQHSYSYRFVRL